jgi:excisionase family DNA binding protein
MMSSRSSAAQSGAGVRTATTLIEDIIEIAEDVVISVDSCQCVILFNPAAEETFADRRLSLLLRKSISLERIERFLPSAVISQAGAGSTLGIRFLQATTCDSQGIRRKQFSGITVTEAAALLSVSHSTVWRWVKGGKLQAHLHIPRDCSRCSIRIEREEFYRFIQLGESRR